MADLYDPKIVKVVDLDMQCRQQQVNDGCFETIEQVPSHALTLTVPALMRPGSVFCMVPGVHKSQAVYHALTEDIASHFPATALRLHPEATLFLDMDSAARIIDRSSTII